MGIDRVGLTCDLRGEGMGIFDVVLATVIFVVEYSVDGAGAVVLHLGFGIAMEGLVVGIVVVAAGIGAYAGKDGGGLG